jgi:GH43 family beta-xylosidase
MIKRLSTLLLCFLWVSVASPVKAADCELQNPLIQFGQDPSVVYQDGYYYLVQSNSGQITIAKSETITGLGQAEAVPVFIPPEGEAYSYDMWAPELQYIDGEWYIYVAATNAPGNNPTHRMYALQADTDDPQGTWTMQGKVSDPSDKWAIDGAVFEYDDQLYMVWSGWETDQGDFPQNLYIAEMSDPLTISGERYLLSEPDQVWERQFAALQEGPQPFIKDDQLSIVYAADASWMPEAYNLGVLVFEGGDPLNREDWEKIGPILEHDDEEGIFAPGHTSSPVFSPDGSEYWYFYHAKMLEEPGWADRAILAAPFTWDAEGVPQFEEPDFFVEAPVGEPCGIDTAETILEEETTFEGDYLDTGESYVNTLGSFTVEAWVKLSRSNPDETYTFVSQGGGIASYFALRYTEGEFAFTLFNIYGNVSSSAVSDINPETDRWYHLVGVREANRLALYVDGELQREAEFEERWEAWDNTYIGAGKHRARPSDLLWGSVRGVRLYSGALQPDDVRQLIE